MAIGDTRTDPAAVLPHDENARMRFMASNRLGGTSLDQSSVPIELLKQKALETVKKRYNMSRQLSMLDYERFARYYRLFRNRQTIRNYTGLANLFVPEPYKNVRQKTARLANAIRSIEVTANHPQSKQSGIVGSHLLNFLRRKLLWQIVERTAIQESRIVGLSWIKALWLLDNEELTKPWKGFDLSFETADNVLLDPLATINDVFQGTNKWLIHMYYADLSFLKRNPNYSSEDLKILEQRGGQVKPDRTPLEQSRLMFSTRNQIVARQRKFKILEFWGKYAPEEEQESTGNERDFLIVIADDSVILRYELNPYAQILDNPIPFIPIIANPVGKELFPIGDLEPAESLFNELNDSRNQRMDTVTLNIDPAKEVIRGANIDPKELIARKGWIIHSNIPNGIRFISPDMQGIRAAIEEEQIIRGDIQQATGNINFSQGTPVEAGLNIDTARGTLVAKGEADVITEDELSILKISLKMLYRVVLAYAQTFLDRRFVMRVIEQGVEQFYTIDRESIQGDLDLDIEMKTLQDRTTDQQLKMMLFNQAKTIPGSKIGKFFTDMLESFYDNVNIQEYYEPPSPTPPEPPRVSISLRGDLSPLESGEIYKQIPGVDPIFADPIMKAEGREMMRGYLPEHSDRQMKALEISAKQKELTIPQKPLTQ